jgi:hypothetical protein
MGFSGKEKDYRNTQFQRNFKFLTLSVRACTIQLTFFFKWQHRFFPTDSGGEFFFKQFLYKKFFYNCKIGIKKIVRRNLNFRISVFDEV